MTRFQRAYYLAFILALMLSLSPSNLLGYVAPIVLLAVLVFLGQSGIVTRNLILWLALWGVVILGQALLADSFALHSAIIAIITYSSFAVVLCIPSSFLANLTLHKRIMRWIRMVVLIEALLGITQAIYGYTQSGSFDFANGDFVEGTIHPWLESELSFSNPMYATNMTLMLLALIPLLIIEKRGGFSVAMGTIALVLASVVHVLLFVAASLFLSVLIYRPVAFKRRMIYFVSFGMILATLFGFLLLRSNLGTLRGYTRMLLSGESYRSQVVMRAVNEMPAEYPQMPLIGLGPGQFSSRAGLIGTGMYFGTPTNPTSIPLMPTGMSQAFNEYVLDLWLTVTEIEAAGISLGSTHQPFFSWLSVYVEMGIIAITAILAFAIYLLWRIKRAARGYHQSIRATFLGSSILFVLFLGLQENYWEIPQAILIGLMLIQVQFAIVTGPLGKRTECSKQLPIPDGSV